MKRLQRENGHRSWTHSPLSLTLSWAWLSTTHITTTRRSNSSTRPWSWTRTFLRRTYSFLPLTKGGLGHLYAILGKKREALTILDELKQLAAQEYVPATSVALIYAGLGEKDEAFA